MPSPRRSPEHCFNPHPAFLPGDATVNPFAAKLWGVSIRTRHFCRVMPGLPPGGKIRQTGFNPHPAFLPGDATSMVPRLPQEKCFNPHPAFLPGDAASDRWCLTPANRFNPHPAFLPGDAGPWCLAGQGESVSIRTRHFCRVMPDQLEQRVDDLLVSIRTRHFCRVMRMFLSSSPSQIDVSIRTRHFCRVMHHRWQISRSPSTSFNPHPAFLPGDALKYWVQFVERFGFQSAPGISAG